ncbi:MAG: 2-amino-4-hydroxy-6-hydroxymethyldihydropteridine diphosphokinase, partial [Muribaculaceae bacterium]|nr:2-amino-4-hydroxy-6-hydroxymethyldihydropteridine diphosphokinase [Muribaculaceae bacterium]
MRIHLNIGSNQGDRAALIERAVALLMRAMPDARVRRSAPVESEPWGFDSPNAFLNIGLMLDLPRDIDPEALLDSTQAAERAISLASHRT